MPIVYEGVGGERGDLFNGLKLWISHRVPQRSRWIDLVKGNGGEVVPLEKHADMLIADNVKRAGAPPPPGAYTWKWIDYSIRNRFLQPTEDYLITPAAPRAVGSSAPAKGTRTPFTNHDDLVLTKFVLSKERTGEGTAGNEIYRELERKHPNHPWQSWRDRWVKILSLRPRPNLSDEASHPEIESGGSQGPGEQRQPAQPAVKPEPESTAQQAQSPGASALASPSPSKSKTKARGRNFFTEEEDNLLLEYIREAQEYNKTVTGNKVRSLGGEKIYREFAQKHPSHTYHSWRDRWVRHLSRREENIAKDPRQGAAEEHVKEPKQRTKGPSEVSRHPTTAEKTTVPSGHVRTPVEKTTAIRKPELSSTLKRPKGKSDEERLERQEQARRKARATKLLQRTWRGYSVRRDHARFETLVVPLQSLVRGYLVRMRESEKLLQASEAKNQLLQDDQEEEDTEQYEDAEEGFDNRDLSAEKSKADDRIAREQFYDDLQDFIDVSGAEVDRQPVVDGRKIDLWDLFNAATRQAYNPEDRSWKEIAEELGFDWTRSARCLLKLSECYNRNLADFEEAIKSYDNIDDVEEEDQQQQQQQMEGDRDSEEGLPQTSDALTAPKEPSEPSSHVYQSSPPVAGVKRSFRHSNVLSSDLGYPSDGSRKRRRLDQRTEIPPTPEDKIGWGGLSGRGGAHDKSSPLKPRGSTTARSFDVDSARVAEEVLEGDMEDIERLDELPEHPPPHKKRFIEPETQDFGFALGSDADVLETAKSGDYDYMADEDDISPSQQLRIESDTINSTPNSTLRNDVFTTDWRPLAAPRPRPAAETSRPASSNPRTAVINAAGDSSRPSSLVNGKTTRRSLPQVYQKPSASAPGRTYGFAQTRNNTAQPRPGPNSSAPLRVSGVTPRGLNGATSRTQQSIPSTPALSKVSSPTPMRLSSRRAPPSTAPSLPQTNRNGLKRSQSADIDNDPAVIDAQFAHFEALGYEKAHIGRALEAATFQRGPMTVALQSLHDGHGLPRNEPGVWTDHDDEKLKAVRDYDRRREKGKYTAGAKDEDERQRVRIERFRARLEAKHGEWVEPRLQFMDMMDRGSRV